jgi:hypothetical protein
MDQGNKKQKTPIEWFFLELLKGHLLLVFRTEERAELMRILSEAKEMEKALLIKAHGNKKVYTSQRDPEILTGEQWYKKTFRND